MIQPQLASSVEKAGFYMRTEGGHADKHVSTMVWRIRVLIYFDRAHALAKPLARFVGDRKALDVLFTVLDDFQVSIVRPVWHFHVDTVASRIHISNLKHYGARFPPLVALCNVLSPYTHATLLKHLLTASEIGGSSPPVCMLLIFAT